MKRFWILLKNRPVALCSVGVLIFLYLQMIFAEFIAPYRPDTVFPSLSYCPPSLVWNSVENGFCPQVQKRVLLDEVTYRYARIRGEHYKVKLFAKGEEYRLLGIFKTNIHLFGTEVPYKNEADGELQNGKSLTYPVFLFGADSLGRDIFSRVVYGSRVSLTIGIIAIFISLSIAVVLGGISGYYGGAIDWIIMRVSEFFILIPGLYLILFIRSLMSRTMDSGQSYMIITVILAFVSWPGSARLIRGMVHSMKREDFVVNAQAEGVPAIVILLKHIIPQLSSILIISVTLGIPGYILGETTLSYLGLGIVDPAVSWGSLISRDATTVGSVIKYTWVIIPGVYLLVTTLAFNFIGEFLRDYFDPFHKSRN